MPPLLPSSAAAQEAMLSVLADAGDAGMGPDIVEKHQIAGLDERERGFSRMTEIEVVDGGFRAVLRYESLTVSTEPHASVGEAVSRLVDSLRAKGYRQLKTRPNFRGTTYLGSQEIWMEYPDPEASESEVRTPHEQLARRTGWIGKVLKLFSAPSAERQ